MEKFKNKNRFIQFELWKDCSLGCKFCFNKKQKDVNKIESLQFVLNKLDDSEMLDYNEIGFIGGEFFNNELKDNDVKQLFYNLFKKLSTMHFEKIYITGALMYDMQQYLIPFLNYLKKLKILEKVLLCTSYDLKYRFYTKEREDLWKNNMLTLHKLYPELKLHTETVITQYFIDAVLNDEFSITEFCNTYHTRLDYIEPTSGLYYKDKQECMKDIPDFFPTKDSFIDFMMKTGVESNEIDLKTFLSMEIRSNKLYYLDKGIRCVSANRRENDGMIVPKDSSIKYEIGFADSDDNMPELVRDFCLTVG